MTIAGRADIQRAMQEAVEAAARGAGARAGQVTQQSLPPIRLQVVKVASEVRLSGSAGLRHDGFAGAAPAAACRATAAVGAAYAAAAFAGGHPPWRRAAVR